MIKNIVFDLGRVLLKFEPIEYLKSIYKNEDKVQLLYNNVFACKEWLDLDRGIISNGEAIQIMSERVPNEKADIEHILKNWVDILTPINGSIEILKILKQKGYNIYLLSNFHKDAFNKVFEEFDFFKCFNGKVVSSDVFLLKPDKEIFIKLCKKYDLKPQESIFIDDTLVNVKAAEEVGFKGIQFICPEQAAVGLKEFGVEV